MQEACQRGVIDPRGPTLAAFSQLRYLVAHGHLLVVDVSLLFRAPHGSEPIVLAHIKPNPQAWRVAAPGRWRPFDACYGVTRPNLGGRANFMVPYKHHLRDARKRRGADARRARQPEGVAPA